MHMGWPAGEKAKFPMSFRVPESASIPASCFRPSETKVHSHVERLVGLCHL